MPGFTYAQLLAALQAWPEDDADEFVANIPRIIELGETRVLRELNLDLFDVVDNAVATVAGTRTVNKPANTVSVRSIRGISAGAGFSIEKRSLDFCKSYAPSVTPQAKPKYWADYSDTQAYLVPTPDAIYTLEQHVVKRPNGLSASNTTTWIGTNCGDLLFAACLMESEHFLKADDRYADMQKKYYGELLPSARAELRNHIRNGDYTPVKPAAKPAE